MTNKNRFIQLDADDYERRLDYARQSVASSRKAFEWATLQGLDVTSFSFGLDVAENNLRSLTESNGLLETTMTFEDAVDDLIADVLGRDDD